MRKGEGSGNVRRTARMCDTIHKSGRFFIRVAERFGMYFRPDGPGEECAMRKGVSTIWMLGAAALLAAMLTGVGGARAAARYARKHGHRAKNDYGSS